MEPDFATTGSLPVGSSSSLTHILDLGILVEQSCGNVLIPHSLREHRCRFTWNELASQLDSVAALRGCAHGSAAQDQGEGSAEGLSAANEQHPPPPPPCHSCARSIAPERGVHCRVPRTASIRIAQPRSMLFCSCGDFLIQTWQADVCLRVHACTCVRRDPEGSPRPEAFNIGCAVLGCPGRAWI